MTETAPPIEVGDGEFAADRRRVDGSRSYWATSATDDGCTLTRWDANDTAWVEASFTRSSSWADAVAADRELVSLRPDELTDFTAPDPDRLLDRLLAEGDGEPDSFDWSIDVEDLDSEDDEFRFDEGQMRRYVHVNGRRVEFAETSGTPIAFVTDEQYAEDVGGTQIAELVYNGGGDPGFSYLHELRAGVAVGMERGELGSRIRGFRHEGDPRTFATMLQEWLSFFDGYGVDGGGAVALALEPLDPRNVLSDQLRADWDDALEFQRTNYDYVFRVTFDVSDAAKEELRAVYRASSVGYVRVRDALADPVQGDWLRAELAEGTTESWW